MTAQSPAARAKALAEEFRGELHNQMAPSLAPPPRNVRLDPLAVTQAADLLDAFAALEDWEAVAKWQTEEIKKVATERNAAQAALASQDDWEALAKWQTEEAEKAEAALAAQETRTCETCRHKGKLSGWREGEPVTMPKCDLWIRVIPKGVDQCAGWTPKEDA